jgi:pimeloyl-ACP methyl ester carboxylesterase
MTFSVWRGESSYIYFITYSFHEYYELIFRNLSSPPPRQVAKIGGTGLLWYLRPRIQSICKNLYPTNPSAVDSVLCNAIRRDSLDPGAINVMISGSKLPPPRTANELLGADFGSAKHRGYMSSFESKFKEGTFDGPVLVAQGLLDPLNDAKGRADMFGKLRDGIKVDPINGGHCPHDELPLDVAKSILSWLETEVSNRATVQV